MSLDVKLRTLADLLIEESSPGPKGCHFARLPDVIADCISNLRMAWNLCLTSPKISSDFLHMLRLPSEYALIAQQTTLIRALAIIRYDLQQNSHTYIPRSRTQSVYASFLVAFYLWQTKCQCEGHDGPFVIRLRQLLPRVITPSRFVSSSSGKSAAASDQRIRDMLPDALPKLEIETEPGENLMHEKALIAARAQCLALFRDRIRTLGMATVEQLIEKLAHDGSSMTQRLFDIMVLHSEQTIDGLLSSHALDYDLNLMLVHYGQTFHADGDLLEWFRAYLDDIFVINNDAAGNECSICLTPMYDRVQKINWRLNCGHTFHRTCVIRWLTTGNRNNCPLCRCPVYECYSE